MLSINRGLRLGLELNVDYVEVKVDVFGEVLALEAQRYLLCFCVVGEIL